MDRINAIDEHGRVLHEEKDGKRIFKEASFNGDVNTPRTPITTKWLNDVQLEILSVIENSSIVPKSGKAQMIESINKIVNKKAQETDASLTRIIEQRTEEVRQELLKKINTKITEVEKHLNSQVQKINTTLSDTNNQITTNITTILGATKKVKSLEKDHENLVSSVFGKAGLSYNQELLKKTVKKLDEYSLLEPFMEYVYCENINELKEDRQVVKILPTDDGRMFLVIRKNRVLPAL